jgi:predicted dehydrogenase
MADKIRWGILGTGVIAHKFALGLKFVPDTELIAVGSRTSTAANAFADRFNVSHRHDSYEALAHDPDVDVIYVSTPHSLHKDNSLLCLNAGKAVLCEKPFTINAAEAEVVINLARQKRLFLMEAMWTRFIPAVVRVRQMITAGTLGEIRMLVADLGFRADFDPQHRLFDPALGGGALLDVGVYTVSFASMLFGPPTRITGLAHLGETGVDEQSAFLLGYGQGQLAILYNAISTDTPTEALVIGTQGRVKLHTPMYCPPQLTLSLSGREDEVIDMPYEGNGYNYEAIEVMNCLRAGKLESDLMPLDETLAIMRTMDQIRTQWGLKYPME